MAKTADHPSVMFSTAGRAFRVLENEGVDVLQFLQLIIDDRSFRDQAVELAASVKWQSLPVNPSPRGLEALTERLFAHMELDDVVKDDFTYYENLRSQLTDLPRTQFSVIVLAYGLKDGVVKTMQDVAGQLSLDRHHVQQAHDKALIHLRRKVQEDQWSFLWKEGGFDDLPIECLGLTDKQRSYLCRVRYNAEKGRSETTHLFASGTRTVQDLLNLSANDLLAVTGFGEATVDKIRAELARHGLRLRGE